MRYVEQKSELNIALAIVISLFVRRFDWNRAFKELAQHCEKEKVFRKNSP